MGNSIVFIHGAWVTPLCWEKFTTFFEGKGSECIAPAWPYKDQPVEELRAHPDPALAKLGIAEIVDHYAKAIQTLNEPPILIGHSFGGLFVQLLLDRGLGAAGIAIDSAPPKGILPFYPSVIKSNFPVLATPGGWRRILRMTFPTFQYAFVNTLPETEQRAAYERYVVPETGRIFFQAAAALFHSTTRVNFHNQQRSPLLLIAGSADHICPAAQIRANYKQYSRASAVTDFKAFEGRCHWIIAQDGWQEVAEYSLNWLTTVQR